MRLSGKPIICLTLTLLCFAVTAAAEGKTLKTLVRGVTCKDDYCAVDSVRVSVWKGDSIQVPIKLTSLSNGDNVTASHDFKFIFEAEQGATYVLHVDKPDYETAEKEFRVRSSKDQVQDLGLLQIRKKRVNELHELVVKGTKVKMVMKGDTIVYDASAFQLPEGSMLEHLVRQLTGISLSDDGVISYNGRPLSELLLNGKEFFKGDAKVALQNLPSYIVKDIKVYDKESKSAYLIGGDKGISKDESNENLVLDVYLKKEYLRSKMANFEAGYGTEERYKARVFGMGISEELRLSVFGKANDIGDVTTADLSGNWRGGWDAPGYHNIQGGGFDYMFDSKKEVVDLSGSFQVMRDETHIYNNASSTRYYPLKDLYGRSSFDSKGTNVSIQTRHQLEINKSSWRLVVAPEFKWNRRRGGSLSANGTFDAFPEESYRGEALDSVFTGTHTDYARSLLTSFLGKSAALSRNLGTVLDANITISPEHWKGSLNIAARGGYNRVSSDSRSTYDQNYGQANTSTSSPLRSDRFNTDKTHSSDISFRSGYSQKFRRLGERYSTTYSLDGGISYSHSNNDEANRLFNAELSTTEGEEYVLPSITMPEHAIADLENTFNSDSKTDKVSAGASFSMRFEPTQQSDDGINPAFHLFASLEYDHRSDRLSYFKPEQAQQFLKQDNNLITPYISLSLQSVNKRRNMNLTCSYNPHTEVVPLRYYLNTTSSANPLYIFMGADGKLKNDISHMGIISFTRYGRGASNSFFRASARFRRRSNAIASAQTYNEMTGVTVSRPININGNWDANIYVQHMFSFGKEKRLELTTTLEGNAVHSVDYITLRTTPERSTVMNYSASPSFRLVYRFKNGSSLSGGYRIRGHRQTSRLDNFNNMTYWDHKPWAACHVVLPAGFSINTQLIVRMNRGFENENMNVDQWLWNATANKSFFKGKLMLSLTCVDILNSVRNVTSHVNAQGRQETYKMMIPRYAMFSLSYHFDVSGR